MIDPNAIEEINARSSRFEMPDVLILAHQRSGTHFLQASLATHPNIHGRGECFLRYQRLIAHPSRQTEVCPKQFIFTNKPNHLNLAILMYGVVNFAVKEFGYSLKDFKIIHLLRIPKQVAYSCAQMQADRKFLGAKFKAHYTVNDSPPPPSLISFQAVKQLETKVTVLQKIYTDKLKTHHDVLTIHYEDLTHGRQVNEISKECASLLLKFLGLEYSPLTNNLKKTGIPKHKKMS